MPGPILYSTNPWLKYHIQKEWRGGVHYVWCSEAYNGAHLNPLDRGAFVAPSSNPADIYRDLAAAVQNGDQHSARIRALRLGVKERATNWHSAGEVSTAALEEIVAIADSNDLRVWKPLVYVIPRFLVEARLEVVPPKDRAGTAMEFRIADLQSIEFDVVQP